VTLHHQRCVLADAAYQMLIYALSACSGQLEAEK